MRIVFLPIFIFIAFFFTSCEQIEVPTKSQYVMDDYGNFFKLVYCDCRNTRAYCLQLIKVDTTEIKIKSFNHLLKNN